MNNNDDLGSKFLEGFYTDFEPTGPNIYKDHSNFLINKYGITEAKAMCLRYRDQIVNELRELNDVDHNTKDESFFSHYHDTHAAACYLMFLLKEIDYEPKQRRLKGYDS